MIYTFIDPLNIFALLLLIYFYSELKSITNKAPKNKIWSYAVKFYFFQYIFIIYELLKELISVDSAFSISETIIIFTKQTIFLLLFYKVKNILHIEYYKRIIINAILIGFLYIGLSSTITNYLLENGYKVEITEEFKFNLTKESNDITEFSVRTSGLYAGHVTQYGAFLSIGIGFALSLINKKRKKLKSIYLLIVIMSCLIGMLLSGTRASLISLFFILLLFIFSRKNNIKNIALLFVFAIIGYYIFRYFGEMYVLRLNQTKSSLLDFRMVIWNLYLEYFFSEPKYWLLGMIERLELHGHIFACHSTLIKILTFGGIPFFILFYTNIYRLFIHGFRFLKNSNYIEFILPFLGYLGASMVNDNYAIFYLPYILLISLEKWEVY